MGFGRRSAEREDDGSYAAASMPGWLLPALAAVAVTGAALAVWQLSGSDHNASFEQSASKLGVTEELRADLRHQFEKDLLGMEREICDESMRDKAGRTAVKYYETLLERPVIDAGLEMTYDSRCQLRADRNSHPFERLFAKRGLGSNLTLPWDCMPARWRTPLDRALQAKLEHVIGTGLLTNDSLTGTLAVVARPTKLSPIGRLCNQPAYRHERRPNLPLISAPTDDWDRQSRRRRY